jgi:hypothetical protein
MNNQSKYHILFIGRVVPAVFLAIFLAGLSGCSGTYGRLVVNSDVKALFERNEVLPDHRYFYTESSTWPRVVIGLHKDYTLQSDFWRPVELTPERLNRWLKFPGDNRLVFMSSNGSDIFDKEGRKIGVWYALKDTRDWGVVQMIDDKTVNIILPAPIEGVIRLPFRRSYEE